MTKALGTFDVKIASLTAYNTSAHAKLARMSIDKQFHGDLDAAGFALQHNATMTRGAPYLNIVVVPDSGTGELLGLGGTMQITIDKGKHSYEFQYSMPD
jgi:hypothetical protein